MKTYLSYVLAGSLAFAGLAIGQEPDNTKVNKRDKNATETTAQNATATKADLDTLKKIRKAVSGEKAFSTYAKNIKITVKNGEATLRGPVRNAEEKTRVEELAKANGATSVVNELEIAPAK
jgi:hyperosmotically inducible periplasmic protein